MKKILFLTIIILLLPTFSLAQNRSRDIEEAENLNRQSGKLYASGDYDHALIIATRELSLRKTIGDDKYIAAVLFNIGGIYRQKKVMNKAVEYFETSIVHYRKGYGNKHERVYKALQQLAFAYLLDEKKRKAIETMNDAKEIAETLYGKESLAVGNILYNQAKVYQMMKMQDNVKKHFEEAIFIYDRFFNQDNEPLRKDVKDYVCFLISATHTDFFKSYNRLQRQRAKKGFRRLKKGVAIGEEIKIGKPYFYWYNSKNYFSKTIIPVEVLVDENGDVINANARCGASSRALKATVKAAYESKFKPSTENGKPIKLSRILFYSVVN